ncbi:hypothetical protein NliqN6_0492 [Naganishia liquefaciens]|uniref:Uncharacterized protein n=1 Tax=Naganishia liquefaciens TaxID=104408 RepID=A0A8H3TPC6_9TREE|nr:hypothetical protein NliqN6_0492 [Naganishia liquefaciens]
MRALYAKNAIYAARRACWGDPIVSVSGKHRKHAVQPSQKVKAKSLQLEERIKALEKQLSEEQVKVAKLEMRQRMVAYLQAVASESGDSA